VVGHAIKESWGLEVQLHSFFISVVDEAEWSASRFRRLSGRKSPLIPIELAGWAPENIINLAADVGNERKMVKAVAQLVQGLTKCVRSDWQRNCG
jgi:hypothetical protein